MQIRDPRQPEPAPEPVPDSLQWRVAPSVPALKIAGAVGLALLGLLFSDGETSRLVVAGLTVTGLLLWAARDLVAPVRVAADRSGVTVVVGFAGHRRLPWSDVERVRVDTRPRFGLRTATLEIDTGETLHLFSAYDLGAPPDDVAARLERLRAA